jgi:hypothetical protein
MPVSALLSCLLAVAQGGMGVDYPVIGWLFRISLRKTKILNLPETSCDKEEGFNPWLNMR